MPSLEPSEEYLGLNHHNTVSESNNTVSTYSNACTHTTSQNINSRLHYGRRGNHLHNNQLDESTDNFHDANDNSNSANGNRPSIANSIYSQTASSIKQPAYIITQLLKRRNRQATYVMLHDQIQKQQQNKNNAINDASSAVLHSGMLRAPEPVMLKDNMDVAGKKVMHITEPTTTEEIHRKVTSNSDKGAGRDSSHLPDTTTDLENTHLERNVFTNYDEIFPYLNFSNEVPVESISKGNSEKNFSYKNIKSWKNLGHHHQSNVDGYPLAYFNSIEQDSYLDPEIFEKKPLPQSLRMSFVVGIFVAVGGFLYGYDTGLINSITDMPYIKDHFTTLPSKQFSAGQHAIIVSSLSIGTFFGALLAPLLSDRYGRRPTVMVATFGVFLIGNTIQICAFDIALLCCGRAVSGFGVGMISAVVPLYQAETVHKSIRGAIISSYQWAITWGLLVSSAVSQGTRLISSSASFRIPVGLQYLWIMIIGFGMYILPESPRYYVLKDELNKAAESLSLLRGVPVDDTGLLEELVEVKANYDYEMSFHTGGVFDCFKSSPTRYKQTLRIFTGIALQTIQQFSGINFIFYYGVNFFQRTGIHSSYLISFITYAVNVVFNIPGLFLVDLIGRRKLLISGAIIMFVANFIVGIVGTVVGTSVQTAKIRIPFICIFIAAFSSTWGGGVWVVCAEMFPLGVRSKCASVCAASNWLANIICAVITPYLVGVPNTSNDTYSQASGSKIFFLWASLNLVGAFLVYFAVYETSGLTLEEIDDVYKKSSSASNSFKVNKEIRMDDSHLIGLLSLARNYNRHKKQNKMNKKGKPTNVTLNTDTTNVSTSATDLDFVDKDDGDGSESFNKFGGVDLKMDSSENEHSFPLTDLTSISDDKKGIQNENKEFVKLDNMNLNAKETTPKDSEKSVTAPSDSFFDLGYGLGLNTHNRGPPSIASEELDTTSSQDIQLNSGMLPFDLHPSSRQATTLRKNGYTLPGMYNKDVGGAKKLASKSEGKSSIGDGDTYTNDIKDYMAQLVAPASLPVVAPQVEVNHTPTLGIGNYEIARPIIPRVFIDDDTTSDEDDDEEESDDLSELENSRSLEHNDDDDETPVGSGIDFSSIIDNINVKQ